MKQPQPEIERYAELLHKYHRSLDLLSDRALASLEGLLADSQSYAELLRSLSPAPRVVLDVGSGAGLPAIPAALRLPHLSFKLVERRRRRAAFLSIAVSQLGLENAVLYPDDVTRLAGFEVDAVMAQGVGNPLHLYRLTCHLHSPTVWIVTRTGGNADQGLEGLESELGTAPEQCEERPLHTRGSLLAVRVAGGLACP